MKTNLHNLFLSRSLRRGASNEGSFLTKNKNILNTKLAASSSKFKGLNYILNGSSQERKPVFRITSLSQSKHQSKKSEDKEREEEPTVPTERIRQNNFSYQMVIGKGGFGKVRISSISYSITI